MLGEVILGQEDVSTVGAVVEVGLGMVMVKVDVGANLYVRHVIS